MSMGDDNKELNELLAKSDGDKYNRRMKGCCGSNPPGMCCEEPEDGRKTEIGNLVQWTTGDGRRFVPASHTKDRLTPGVYEIMHSPTCGIFFEKIPVKTEGLLRFPQTNSDRVVREIQTFWDKESNFREYGLTYKRGIILWGPPGSGKSCTIQLIMKDVVEREGIVIKFTNPGLFLEGMRVFREIEKETPVVILMEDIDSTLEIFNESEVLNILDGIDQVEKVVFLATTNYPERLGGRILNRPSRFDKRFKIGHPNAESRLMYFKHLIGQKKIEELNIDLSKWVKDTDKFSIAHLKELFVAVVILGDSYNEAIKTLRSMKELISSSDDRERMVGFMGTNADEYGDCQ